MGLAARCVMRVALGGILSRGTFSSTAEGRGLTNLPERFYPGWRLCVTDAGLPL